MMESNFISFEENTVDSGISDYLTTVSELAPIRHSLTHAPIPTGVDDLSLGGWSKREEAYRSLQIIATKANDDQISQNREIDTWLQQRIMRHRLEFARPNKDRLMYTAFGLLPFVLFPELPDFLLRERALGMLPWYPGRSGTPNPKAASVASAIEELAESREFTSRSALVALAAVIRQSPEEPSSASLPNITIDDLLGSYRTDNDPDQLSEQIAANATSAIRAIAGYEPLARSTIYSNAPKLEEMAQSVLPHVRLHKQTELILPDANVTIMIAPRIVAPFVADGMYLHGWGQTDVAGTALLPGVFRDQAFVDSNKLDKMLVQFIAHEMFPGHATHRILGETGPYSKFLRIGYAAESYEGHACLCEESIVQDAGSAFAANLLRVRRLLPVCALLAKRGGKSQFDFECVTKSIALLESHTQGILLPFMNARLGPLMLPYAIGITLLQDFSQKNSSMNIYDISRIGPVSLETLSKFFERNDSIR